MKHVSRAEAYRALPAHVNAPGLGQEYFSFTFDGDDQWKTTAG
jgi:hypothetical protein